MPLQKLNFKPGVNRENTRYTNEGRWWGMDKVRFRSGTPEKIGGWVRLGPNVFLGVARHLHNWVTLAGENLLSVGTNLKMYLERGQGFFDITPIRTTFTGLNNPFTTGTAGSSVVTAMITAHGASTGDFVTFAGAAAVDGILAATLNAEFQITVLSSSIFTFVATPCTAGAVTGGGAAVSAAFQVGTGPSVAVSGVGWGITSWGTTSPPAVASFTGSIAGTVLTASAVTGVIAAGDIVRGTGVITGTHIVSQITGPVGGAGTYNVFSGTGGIGAASASQTVGAEAMTTALAVTADGWGEAASGSFLVTTGLRQWVGGNFGQDFICSIRDGGIYYWSATGGSISYLLSVRATALSAQPGASNAPIIADNLLITDDQHVVIVGTNAIGSTTEDPMLVRWCAQGNPLNWTPAITNTAGDQRLTAGSYTYAVHSMRQENLIWTDTALISMQFVGPPIVFSFSTLADNISIASVNAVAVANNVAYWMGKDKFYVYTGKVDTLPCDVRKYVFSGMNLSQLAQVHAGTNAQFNEITWWYCFTGSLVCDRYVTYNYVENLWTFGTMSRSAWLDSPLRSNPIGAGTDGRLYYHEQGLDDGSASPAVALPAYLESADFDIGDGEQFSFVERIIPDVDFDNSTAAVPTVILTVSARNTPGANFVQTNARNVSQTTIVPFSQFTEMVWVRLRGRQMSFRIESNAVGVTWQLGAPRIGLREDGAR